MFVLSHTITLFVSGRNILPHHGVFYDLTMNLFLEKVKRSSTDSCIRIEAASFHRVKYVIIRCKEIFRYAILRNILLRFWRKANPTMKSNWIRWFTSGFFEKNCSEVIVFELFISDIVDLETIGTYLCMLVHDL